MLGPLDSRVQYSIVRFCFLKKSKSYSNLCLFQVYGEDAVRVTPPNSTVNLTVSGDEVEGPNGECPPVSLIQTYIMILETTFIDLKN